MRSSRGARLTSGLTAFGRLATGLSMSWLSGRRGWGARMVATGLGVLLALLVSAASVRAAPQLERFYLPALRNPEFATRGPDGAVWFTVGNALGRVSADGGVKLYPTRGLEPIDPT